MQLQTVAALLAAHPQRASVRLAAALARVPPRDRDRRLLDLGCCCCSLLLLLLIAAAAAHCNGKVSMVLAAVPRDCNGCLDRRAGSDERGTCRGQAVYVTRHMFRVTSSTRDT